MDDGVVGDGWGGDEAVKACYLRLGVFSGDGDFSGER